jgi:hypothetical protein
MQSAKMEADGVGVTVSATIVGPKYAKESSKGEKKSTDDTWSIYVR